MSRLKHKEFREYFFAGGVLISYHSLQAIGARHAPPGVTAAAALVGAIILRGLMSWPRC